MRPSAPDRRPTILQWHGGYRPLCDCGWDDGRFDTKAGAELAFERHECIPSDRRSA